MKIVLATTNSGKKIELIHLLKNTAWDVLTLADFPRMPDVVEDGETFEANAIKKAYAVSVHTGLLTLADDSGLEIQALNKRPGVFSARYSGHKATAQSNIEKVLNELKGVSWNQRQARFVCSMALLNQGEILGVVNGECWGYIAESVQGEGGFGYDPVFFLAEQGKTFAQISLEEKNKISHRGQALQKMLPILKALA